MSTVQAIARNTTVLLVARTAADAGKIAGEIVSFAGRNPFRIGVVIWLVTLWGARTSMQRYPFISPASMGYNGKAASSCH